MKTSVTMIRKMGKFNVLQRTKDGMFDATSLLKQWNESSGQKKVIGHFFENNATKEFIQAILDDETKDRNTDEISLSDVYTKKRGIYGGTWMHPLLFIDFAMWLNPSFKVKVLKFVYDQLIKYRHEAGDNYKILSSSGSKLKGYNYVEVAKALQWIVFNKTGKELRQKASEEQLEELKDIQNKLAFAIDTGLIKTYTQLMKQLRKIYHQKHNQLTVTN